MKDGLMQRTEALERVVAKMWDTVEALQKHAQAQNENIRKLADAINISNRQHCDNAKALADGINQRSLVPKGAAVVNLSVAAYPRETEEKIERDAKGEMTRVVRRVTRG